METRVKKYKTYRKQINKEFQILSKNNKNVKELSKLESKLSKIDKSLTKVEEVDLFSVDTFYDEEWQNYLKPLKELISFYDLNEISKILLLSSEPSKNIKLDKEGYKNLINSLLENDLNYSEIIKIRKKISNKYKNQEEYKRNIKDLNNYIEKMLIDWKKVRFDKKFINDLKKHNNSIRNSKFFRIFFIIVSTICIICLFIGITLLIIGALNGI